MSGTAEAESHAVLPFNSGPTLRPRQPSNVTPSPLDMYDRETSTTKHFWRSNLAPVDGRVSGHSIFWGRNLTPADGTPDNDFLVFFSENLVPHFLNVTLS